MHHVLALFAACAATALLPLARAAQAPHAPVAPPDLVFAETGGLVAFEAEHFVRQELTAVRAWHVTTATIRPGLAPDTDGTHVLGASGGAYLEILPDTRWSRDEPNVEGQSFSPDPGKLAVLTYRVHFATPGRYHVWARVHSTGSEDNGMHFGIDGRWPASGRQWQTIIKNQWAWDSRQRTNEVHAGVPGKLFLDVPTAGEHTIHVSMREDGVELDRLLLTIDPAYVPSGTGPASQVRSGRVPEPYAIPANYQEAPGLTPLAPKLPPPVADRHPGVVPTSSLKLEGTGFHLEDGQWAAIAPGAGKTAAVSFAPNLPEDRYDVTLHTAGDASGGASFEVLVGGRSLGDFSRPAARLTAADAARLDPGWSNVAFNAGDRVEVRVRTAGSASSHARWSKIVFAPRPIAPPDLVFAEQDGLVTFEAEHFVKQEAIEPRAWHLTHASRHPKLAPDTDGTHVTGASGGAYLELLPDTRWSHSEPLVAGDNFTEEAGTMAVLTYRVRFATAGRYHVWARVFSTGPEDNSLHFGLDGGWPESGRRWQTTRKNAWIWDSRQRTETAHAGVPGQMYLDVAAPGEHLVHVSLREDGIELDKILLTTDKSYVPDGAGPAPQVFAGAAPAPYPVPADYAEAPATTMPVARVAAPAAPRPPAAPDAPGTISAPHLKLAGTNFYLDRNKWAAIHPEEHKSAAVKFPAPVSAGRHDVTLHVVGESDGNSSFDVLLDGRMLGTFTAPPSQEMFEEGPTFTRTWRDVEVRAGATVEVRARIASNDGLEWSRARWSKLTFTPSVGDTPASPVRQ